MLRTQTHTFSAWPRLTDFSVVAASSRSRFSHFNTFSFLMPYALVSFICYLPIFLAELLTRHGQACLWALRGEAAMSPVADRDGSRMAFNLNLLTDVLAQLLYLCTSL